MIPIKSCHCERSRHLQIGKEAFSPQLFLRADCNSESYCTERGKESLLELLCMTYARSICLYYLLGNRTSFLSEFSKWCLLGSPSCNDLWRVFLFGDRSRSVHLLEPASGDFCWLMIMCRTMVQSCVGSCIGSKTKLKRTISFEDCKLCRFQAQTLFRFSACLLFSDRKFHHESLSECQRLFYRVPADGASLDADFCRILLKYVARFLQRRRKRIWHGA